MTWLLPLKLRSVVIENEKKNLNFFIRKENFVIGDIEDLKRFIKLNTLAGEDWSRVWKGRN